MAMNHEVIRRTAGLMDQAADPTRLGVLVALAGGEVAVGDLVAGLPGMNQPALSHHLKLMRLGGLVDFRREGKSNRYTLTATGRAVLAAAEGLAGGGG